MVRVRISVTVYWAVYSTIHGKFHIHRPLVDPVTATSPAHTPGVLLIIESAESAPTQGTN